MNHFWLIILSALMLMACTDSSEVDSAFDFDIESAIQVLDMARDIEAGKALDENAWTALFKSPGYKHFLVYRDSVWKMDLIREAMYTVFEPSNVAIKDSLLKIPITTGRNYMKLALTHNFNGIKANFNEIDHFLKNTDFNDVLREAKSLAKSHIAEEDRNNSPELYPIFVAVTDPDGKVQKGAIILDLNLMYGLGKEGLTRFIAHEFHHNYRKLKAVQYDSPVMAEITRIHQEGVADLIDKKQPPIHELGLYPQSLIDEYNADYINSPGRLQTFDSLVVAYSKGVIEESDFNSLVKGYFKFGGHTTGIYMSFLINRTIGKEKLIDSYADPMAFLTLYNRVAKGQQGEYVFSDDFMNYVSKLAEESSK